MPASIETIRSVLLLAFRYESSADSRHGTSSLYNDRGTKLRTTTVAPSFVQRPWHQASYNDRGTKLRTTTVAPSFVRLYRSMMSLLDRRIQPDRRRQCPRLVLSGRAPVHKHIPLSGVKRTWAGAAQASAFDPKRTYRNFPNIRRNLVTFLIQESGKCRKASILCLPMTVFKGGMP